MTLATNGNSKAYHDYHELLHSQCTLLISSAACPFAKPCAPDLHDIEEKIVFSSSDDNKEYDDEDILLEIEACILFAMQLFPHHDDIFLQALYDFVPSSIEMTHQMQALCLDDFCDGAPLSVIEKSPLSRSLLLVNKSCVNIPRILLDCCLMYPILVASNGPISHVFCTKDSLVTATITAFQDPEDRVFPDALYPP